MKLINTDGLAFIGPGSEWFWSAVSAVVVAVTFVAIYRRLRLQRNAAAVERVEALFRDWQSERMSSKLEVLLAIQAKAAPLDVPEMAASDIGDFMERTAIPRAKRAHGQATGSFGPITAGTAVVGTSPPEHPCLARARRYAEEWREFEWLARTMAEMDTKSGTPQPSDAAYLASHLDELIALIRRAVGIGRGAPDVLVRLTPTPIPVERRLVHPDASASAPLEDRSE